LEGIEPVSLRGEIINPVDDDELRRTFSRPWRAGLS
jgi:hypothetical protein